MDEESCLRLLNALLSNEAALQADLESTVTDLCAENRQLHLKLMADIRLIRCFGQLEEISYQLEAGLKFRIYLRQQ